MHAHAKALLIGPASLLVTALIGCGSEEARRLAVPVVVDPPTTLTATSDLGWQVTLTRARAAIGDLELTLGGGVHAAVPRRVLRWLLPVAHAHPGHETGGEVNGELRGAFVVDLFAAGTPLGSATVLPARYQAANFELRVASAAELPAADPLVGHTFELAGLAQKGERTVAFTALLRAEDASVDGVPCRHELTAARPGTLGLRFLPGQSASPAKSVFDGVDFALLAGAADSVAIVPGQAVHNQLVRALRVHDAYEITHR